jgi:drug/metabolite transporter (DMT)-like permease
MLARLGGLHVDGLLLVVALSWGSTYLVSKELVGPESVVALLAVRMLAAAPLLVVAIAAWRRGRLPARGEWAVGVVLGALLSGVFLLETLGIAHTSATNAGVIISLTIVFTPLLESAVTRRPLPVRFYGAALGALVGVALLTSGSALARPTLGDGLVLGAAVLRAMHVTAMHRLSSRLSTRSQTSPDSAILTAIQLTTCAVLFGAGSGFVGESVPQYVGRLSASGAVLLLYLVVVCTVFAFFVQMWAVRRTSPTRVSLLLGTEPVWAALIGAFVAHDVLSPVAWCGIAVILLSTAWGRRVDTRRSLELAVKIGPAVQSQKAP